MVRIEPNSIFSSFKLHNSIAAFFSISSRSLFDSIAFAPNANSAEIFRRLSRAFFWYKTWLLKWMRKHRWKRCRRKWLEARTSWAWRWEEQREFKILENWREARFGEFSPRAELAECLQMKALRDSSFQDKYCILRFACIIQERSPNTTQVHVYKIKDFKWKYFEDFKNSWALY